MSSSAAERPAALLAPFGVLGVVGGWIVGYHFLRAWPIPPADARTLHALCVVVSGAAGMLLGRALSRVADRDRPADSIVALTIATLLLCGVGGAFVGGAYSTLGGAITVRGLDRGAPFIDSILIGLLHGLAYALMFLPAFMAVLVVALRVGRARAGSVIDAADRRAVWLACALVLALTACTISLLAPAARPLAHGLALVCVGGIMTLLLLDVRALDALTTEAASRGEGSAAPASANRATLISVENLAVARREIVRTLLVDGVALVASASVLLAVLRLGH